MQFHWRTTDEYRLFRVWKVLPTVYLKVVLKPFRNTSLLRRIVKQLWNSFGMVWKQFQNKLIPICEGLKRQWNLDWIICVARWIHRKIMTNKSWWNQSFFCKQRTIWMSVVCDTTDFYCQWPVLSKDVTSNCRDYLRKNK